MLHVQFAAVMPPARIARKISGPKFETIRPSRIPQIRSTAKMLIVCGEGLHEGFRMRHSSLADCSRGLLSLKLLLQSVHVMNARTDARERRCIARIRGIATLRHDPLQAELTGMMEDEQAVLLIEVLVEAQPTARSRARAVKQGFPLGQ